MSNLSTGLGGRTKKRPPFLYNPFARIETAAEAQWAAKLGVIPVVLLCLSNGLELVKVVIAASHRPGPTALVWVWAGVDIALISLLVLCGVKLRRTQPVWAARVVLGLALVTVLLQALAAGLVSLISFRTIALVSTAVLCHRGTRRLAEMASVPGARVS